MFPGVLIMLVRVNIAITASLHEKLCILMYSKKFFSRAVNAQFFQYMCEKWIILIRNCQKNEEFNISNIQKIMISLIKAIMIIFCMLISTLHVNFMIFCM